jgi:hypothetical protein
MSVRSKGREAVVDAKTLKVWELSIASGEESTKDGIYVWKEQTRRLPSLTYITCGVKMHQMSSRFIIISIRSSVGIGLHR